ncbi:uncharacterized protein LOC113359506 [Papaver somniferum]|uniref:uncharacterized protein LOC113359506 n=1 Tax=Papaver somniferum TaxID=3469 RepID=UPI000E6FA68A|nr:uncharacterized protein LOC113359506 [Papaver somniferum]
MENVPRPLGGEDKVWKPDFKGNLTIISAKDLLRKKYPKLEGANLLWRHSIHPSLVARNWKLLRGDCATLDKVRSRFKFQVVNKCCLYNREEETLEHVLWSCDFAIRAWRWISEIFGLNPHQNLTTAYKQAKGKSRMFKDVWLLSIPVIRSELWMTRNIYVYGNSKVSWQFFHKKVFNQSHEYLRRLKGDMFNNQDDLRVLSFFRVQHRRVKVMHPKECFWIPPNHDELMLFCDGAGRGSPGRAGAGVVVRDAGANVLGAMSVGFGIQTNYLAKLFCVIVGLKWTLKFEVRNICIHTDFMGAVLAYSSDIGVVSLFLRQRWVAVRARYNTIRFVHTYKEANFAANKMAKRGCLLNDGEGMSYDGRPDFISSIELPNVSNFRFD